MSKKQVITLLILSILSFVVFYVFSTQSEPTYSEADTTELIAVTDLAGRTIPIKKDIQRIVLLRGRDIYQLAPLLGDELAEKLVAWGSDLKANDQEAYRKFTAKYPALKNLPETGNAYEDGLSVEQLTKLAPDLIIADKLLLDRGYQYVAKLEDAGLPVIYLDGSNDPLTGSQQGIKLLGQIFEKEEKAEEIVTYVNEQLEEVLSTIQPLTKPEPSVYLEQGAAGPETFGDTYGGAGDPKEYTSWGMVMQQLRVNNIADSVASQQEPVHPEYLLKANPDVIVITGQNWEATPDAMRLGYFVRPNEARRQLQNFTRRPGWAGLKAVQNKRVHGVFHNTSVITSFASIQALAKACYPDEFKEMNPADNLREFYDKFMPIDYSGTWMVDLP